MSRLRAWHRRWLLWGYGQCIEDGCSEPRGEGICFERCHRHADEYWRRRSAEMRKEEREREIAIQAEALRRTLPEALKAAADQGEGER